MSVTQEFKIRKGKFFLIILFLGLSIPSRSQILKDIKNVADKVTSISVDKLSKDPITTSFKDVDMKNIESEDFGSTANYANLHDQPFDPATGFRLEPGYYEADVQSFCIKAGTYMPTRGSGRFYAEMKGPKADIFESILTTLHTDRSVSQRDVQLLLWAIIAKTDFQKMSGPIKATAIQILTPEQIARLSKGALENIGRKKLNKLAYKNDALRAIIEAENNMRSKFYSGVSDYAEYEAIAMLAGVEPVVTGYEYGKWSSHPDGYLVRYKPSGYSKTNVQIYVPSQSGTVVFNALGDIAVPASTSAQRLLQTNIPYNDPDWSYGNIGNSDDNDDIKCVEVIDPIIDQVLREQLIIQDLPGIVAAVFRNGEIVHMKAYGVTDAFSKTELSINTVMQWQSISKSVTSVAALQLEENASLNYSVSDLVTDHVDYWADNIPSYQTTQGRTRNDNRVSTITISDLLRNRGGINHYGRGRDANGTRVNWTIINTDTVQLWENKSLYIHERDQYNAQKSVEMFDQSVLANNVGDYLYSTYGFCLAAATIDEASPNGYVDWIESNIAAPANMTSFRVSNVCTSGLNIPDCTNDPVAGQARFRDGVLTQVLASDKEDVLPGGGWESNICDLSKYALALSKGDFFEQNKDGLWNINTSTTYKYGINSSGSGNSAEVWHGGADNNIRTYMKFYQADTSGIVLFAPAPYARLPQLADQVFRDSGIDISAGVANSTPVDSCRYQMNNASNPDLFNLVWRQTNDDVLLRTGLRDDIFYDEVQKLRGNGYQLVDIEVFEENGERYWDGVFKQNHPRTRVLRNGNKENFVQACEEQRQEGYRLMDVETYLKSNGTRLWAGVFRKTDDAYAVRLDRTTSEFAEIRESEQQKGNKLIDIEVYRKDGENYWSGVFTKGSKNFLRRNMSETEFNNLAVTQVNDGYRLIDIEYQLFTVNSTQSWRVSAIWEKSNENENYGLRGDFCTVTAAHDNWSSQGFELIDWERLPQ